MTKLNIFCRCSLIPEKKLKTTTNIFVIKQEKLPSNQVLILSLSKLSSFDFYISHIILSTDQISNQIRQCTTNDKNSLLVYGQYMPALVQAIKSHHANGGFSELPRGPFGQYIEVIEDKWKTAVEHILGGKLLTFCVNNVKDRIALNKLIKTSFPAATKLPIITTKFHHQAYNVQNGCVRELPNTYLAMNLIKCSDPVVMNCLIDHVKIETILLCHDQDLAERLTTDEENVPHNLQKVILLKPFTEYYPAPSYRTYSCEVRAVRYIQVNMDERNW